MANINIDVGVNSTQAQKGLNELQNSIKSFDNAVNNSTTSTNKLNSSLKTTNADAAKVGTTGKSSFNSFKGAINETNTAVNVVNKSLTSMKTIAAGAFAALQLDKILGSFTSITTTAIDNAEDIFGRGGQLNHFYSENVTDLTNWAESSAYLYQMSTREAEKYLNDFSGVMRNFDVDSEESLAKIATNLTKLSGDLAKTWNAETEPVEKAIFNAIYSGSTKALRDYGVVMNEETINAYLLSEGIDATYNSLTKSEQGLVRYAYLMHETTYAQGEFNDALDTWGASVVTLQNEWDSFLTLLGQYAIPIIQPVVKALAYAIEYAKAFVEALAEILGLQKYVAVETEATIAPMKMTANLGEDIEDASDKNLDNIKATNKELKKGAKLLDLYTVDFGDTSTTDGVSVTNGDVENSDDLKTNLQDIANSFDYIDSKSNWLSDLQIDTDKVREAAQWTADLINNLIALGSKIWTFEIFGVSLESLFQDFLDDPLGTLAKIFGTIFAAKTLLTFAKTYILPNLVKSGVGALIGSSLAAAIFGGITGFFISHSIFDDIIEHERPDDFATSFMSTLGGALTGAIAGGSMAGVPGAIVGALLGGAGGMAGGELAKQLELREAFSKEFDALMAEGPTYREKYNAMFVSIFGTEDFTSVYRTLSDEQNELNAETETYITTTIPGLLAAIQQNPGDANLLTELEKAAEGLRDNLDKATQLQTEIDAEVFKSIYGDLATNLESANTNSGELYTNLVKIKENAELEEHADYTDYITKLASGIQLTDEEMERFTYLQEKYGTVTDKANAIAEGFSKKFDSAIASGKTYAEAMEELKDDYDAVQQAYTDAEIGAQYALKKGTITPEQEAAIIETITKEQHNVWEKVNGVITDMSSEWIESTNNSLMTAIGENIFAANQGVINEYAQTAYKELLSGHEWTMDENEVAAMWDSFISDYGAGIAFEKIPGAFVDHIAKVFNISADDPMYKEKVSSAYTNMLNGLFLDMGFNLDLSNAQIKIDTSSIRKADPTLTNDFIRSQIPNTKYTSVQTDASGQIVITTNTLSLVEPTVKYANVSIPQSERDKYIDQLYSEGSAAINTSQDKLKTEIESKDVGADSGKELGDNVANAEAKAITDNDNVTEMTNATKTALQSVTNNTDAETKGNELGSHYVSGLTNAIKAAHNENSEYNNALKNLVDDFKTALDSISSNINNWAHNLANAVSGLDIPSDVTFTGLIDIIKTKGNSFNIPKLANGAVIPPNNPFLAVLGDQHSGYNIEAPVSTIEEVVRDANSEQEIVVNNTIYIGNSEIKDYIVDTVVDNNLVTG